MATENVYGLSEGVFKACRFLGLKFPAEAIAKENLTPSDYFGNNFAFSPAMLEKLWRNSNSTVQQFKTRYKNFLEKFFTQKPLKHTKTDANVYFCDYVLFARKQNGASHNDYFDFEFYSKSFARRARFITQRHRKQFTFICNEHEFSSLSRDKARTNETFQDFLHRDWLNIRKCTLEEFKAFVAKHSSFFAKPIEGTGGAGAEIIRVAANENLEKLFATLKEKDSILEEIVTQHEALSAFCADTVNTIRVYTLLDMHNVAHILMTFGRFGRVGKVVDNFHQGGYSAIINPRTGIITSDGLNRDHERKLTHPDTGKTFKGFQYPCWEKLCATVKKMAKRLPQLRHIGWDVTISDKGEIVLIEVNGRLNIDAPQAVDDTGRLPRYVSLIKGMKSYKQRQMRFLGYRVNNLRNFDSAYETSLRDDSTLKFAAGKLIHDCASLIDVGCRKDKRSKSFCPEGVKYFPVDFKAHDDEIIACDFNANFPDIKADACLCAFTAEFVERLPKFLANMCNAAQKQILMICRPVDRERDIEFRWRNPFLTDFTEEFLIKTMAQNKFKLDKRYPTGDKSVILYDFRKISR